MYDKRFFLQFYLKKKKKKDLRNCKMNSRKLFIWSLPSYHNGNSLFAILAILKVSLWT